MSERRPITGSSVLRAAGNILSGIAANPRTGTITTNHADLAFAQAAYLATLAEQYDKAGGMPRRQDYQRDPRAEFPDPKS